jgi:hypothetical protein
MLTLFTIVLNGEPYIEQHFDTLRQLTIPWQWRIVEGVAEPTHCTSWCRTMPDRWHRDYVSVDGTHEYLRAVDGLRAGEGSISVSFRRSPWPGKLAMVNRALEGVEDGVVMQVDSDEIWQAWQLERVYEMLLPQPPRTAARFHCNYWVGPRKVLTNTSGWARGDLEWLRAWRWGPGVKMLRHEPPIVTGFDRCVSIESTMAMGLVFDHFAYVTEQQIAWKEDYYGMDGLTDAWHRLQATRGPVNLQEFIPSAFGATADDFGTEEEE